MEDTLLLTVLINNLNNLITIINSNNNNLNNLIMDLLTLKIMDKLQKELDFEIKNNN